MNNSLNKFCTNIFFNTAANGLASKNFLNS